MMALGCIRVSNIPNLLTSRLGTGPGWRPPPSHAAETRDCLAGLGRASEVQVRCP